MRRKAVGLLALDVVAVNADVAGMRSARIAKRDKKMAIFVVLILFRFFDVCYFLFKK